MTRRDIIWAVLFSILASGTTLLVLGSWHDRPEKPPVVNCEDHPLPESVK